MTFPYILLISLSSLAGAILNTWNRFSVPAFVPTLLNVSMIIFALFLTPYFDPPVMALGWPFSPVVWRNCFTNCRT